MVLIDKHKARKAIHEHNPSGKLLRRETVLKLLGALPEVDPVHAAGGCYCRECEYRETEACPMCHEEWIDDEEDGLGSILHNNATDENGFCSYGRRRESEYLK